MKSLRCLVSVPFLIVACSSSSEPSTTGDDAEILAEAREAATRGTAPSELAATKAITELFVHEDPTIDPTKSATENADAVAAEAKAAICPTAKLTHATGTATVSVDFGSGCTIGSLGTVSGSVAVTVSKTGGTVSVGFVLTKVAVKGFTVDGTVTAATSDGTTYDTSIDVKANGDHVTFKGAIGLDADLKGITLDGNGTIQTSAAPATPYVAKGVHHLFGGCYADAGTVAITKQTTLKGKSVTLTETITFSSTTPKTGQVTVTINAQTSTRTLPSYGSCPTG